MSQIREKQKKISIIIPTYREEQNLQKIIPTVFSIVPKATIIVVDDNSPDKTKEVIKKLKIKYKNLIFISRDKKDGRGSAVVEGFTHALKTHTDIFIEMDADFSHDPHELPTIIGLSKPKTVVVASRYMKGSNIVNVPPKRKFLSILANVFVKMLLNLPASDNTNGFRAYREDAVKILLDHSFVSKGYILLSESAYLLKQKGFSFIETPSTFVNRRIGQSNATFKEFSSSFKNILRIRFKKR